MSRSCGIATAMQEFKISEAQRFKLAAEPVK
jgi:hypothetical protein